MKEKKYRGDASRGMDNRVVKGALKEIRNFIYEKSVLCSESIFACLGQAQLLSLILPLNKSFVNCGDRNSERWKRSVTSAIVGQDERWRRDFFEKLFS